MVSPIPWTSPRSWVAGEVVTAALLNTHLRDNLLMLDPANSALTAGSASVPIVDSRVYRVGGGGTLHVDFTPTAAVPISTVLYTVPVGWRPVKRVHFMVDQAGTKILFQIAVDGSVANIGAALTTSTVFGTGSYVIV